MIHELDLIPAAYRERIRIQRWLKYFAAISAAILIIIIGLKIKIDRQLTGLNSEIKILHKDKQLNIQQQQKFNDLQNQEKSLAARLKILDGLRGGPPVRQILLAVDRIMNNDIWFTQWKFIRSNEITEIKPETVQTGYFIIIPEDLNQTNKKQAWKLESHMEITGQAINHSILANFVRQLIDQPEVTDVKLINTSLRTSSDVQVVDFKMAVIVNNRYEI
jgi:hypothetical protein